MRAVNRPIQGTLPAAQIRQKVNPAEQRTHGLGGLEYALLLLVFVQVFLLGTTNELGASKFIYAALFFAVYMIWGFSALAVMPKWNGQPVFRWTLYLFILCIFSRFVGMQHRIATIDWIRELTALSGYSWIFFVPVFLTKGKSARPFYLALLIVNGILSIGNAILLMQNRGFGAQGADLAVALTGVASAPLFGYFMSAGLAMAEQSQKRKKYILLESAFFLVALLSGTRTTMIAIIMGTAFYCWLLRKGRKPADYRQRVFALAAPVLIATLLFVTAVLSGVINREAVETRIEQTMEGSQAITLVNRINEAQDAWKAIKQHPIVGQGLGYKLGTVFLIGAELEPQDDYFVHDFYLYVLVKFGIIGFLIFGGLIVAMFSTALFGFKRATLPFERGLFGSAAALIVAMLIESITANLFSNRASAGVLALIMGMVAVLARKCRIRTRLQASSVPVQAAPGLGT